MSNENRFPDNMRESEAVGQLTAMAKDNTERRVSEGQGGINGPKVLDMTTGQSEAVHNCQESGSVSDPAMKDLPQAKQDQWNNELKNLSSH